jgi:hypothetical protein
MSFDVKNHLSGRHRTEIHLQPAIHAAATGIPRKEPAAGRDSHWNDWVMNPLEIPTPSAPEGVPIVIAKSLQA